MQQSNHDLKEQEGNPPQDAPASNSQEEQAKPLFSGVDSQGKERLFKSVEEAQQSWQNAQNFIKDTVSEKSALESRIQELEAQLNQSTKLEEALAKLNSKEKESPVTDTTSDATTETTPQVDVEQLKQQIRDEVLGSLTQAQREEHYKTNQAESIAAAQAVYGDSYEEKLRERAKQLDMSDEDIIKEAQSNPKRFKTLFGLDKQQPKSYTPSSSASGFNQSSDKPSLSFNKGFSEKERLGSHLENLNAIAKAKGLNIKF